MTAARARDAIPAGLDLQDPAHAVRARRRRRSRRVPGVPLGRHPTRHRGLEPRPGPALFDAQLDGVGLSAVRAGDRRGARAAVPAEHRLRQRRSGRRPRTILARRRPAHLGRRAGRLPARAVPQRAAVRARAPATGEGHPHRRGRTGLDPAREDRLAGARWNRRSGGGSAGSSAPQARCSSPSTSTCRPAPPTRPSARRSRAPSCGRWTRCPPTTNSAAPPDHRGATCNNSTVTCTSSSCTESAWRTAWASSAAPVDKLSMQAYLPCRHAIRAGPARPPPGRVRESLPEPH